MKKQIVSVLLFVWSFSVTADDFQGTFLARITDEQVHALEAKIASDITQDTVKKRLVFTAALAAGGYLAYRYIYATPDQVPFLPASAEQIALNNSLLQHNNELLRQSLPDMQNVSASWLRDSSLGKFGAYIWEIGKWSAQQAVFGYMANVMLLGTSGALNKMVKTVDSAVDSITFHLFHARDLKWFLISRARVANMFNELESHAFCVQNGMLDAVTDLEGHEQQSADQPFNQASMLLDEASYTYHKIAFMQTWQQLAERLAALVAFIEFKAHMAERKSVQERLLLGAQHIMQLTNATAQQCESMLTQAQLANMPEALLAVVQRLRSSVSDELVLANKLEHEMNW